MTASEKGKELIEKFRPLVRDRKTERTDTHITGSIGQHVITENAKSCALICVDEIIDSYKEISDKSWLARSEVTFWQAVKSFVENK